jgi:histidine triad (HIT) family protein
VRDLYTLPDDLAAPVLLAVRATARAVKEVFRADGITVRQNNEAAGGQDVFHFHIHVVPRFHGDDFDTARYETVDEVTRSAQAAALRRVL